MKVRRQPHKFSVPSTSLQQGLLFSMSIPGSLIHKTLGNSLVSGLTLGVLGVLKLQIHVYPVWLYMVLNSSSYTCAASILLIEPSPQSRCVLLTAALIFCHFQDVAFKIYYVSASPGGSAYLRRSLWLHTAIPGF